MADEEWADDMKPVLGEVELPSNFESILPDYPFKVADFKGPLDPLINLIKKNQVDIYAIPFVLITNQYLEYLELQVLFDLDGERQVGMLDRVGVFVRVEESRGDSFLGQRHHGDQVVVLRRGVDDGLFDGALSSLGSGSRSARPE